MIKNRSTKYIASETNGFVNYWFTIVDLYFRKTNIDFGNFFEKAHFIHFSRVLRSSPANDEQTSGFTVLSVLELNIPLYLYCVLRENKSATHIRQTTSLSDIPLSITFRWLNYLIHGVHLINFRWRDKKENFLSENLQKYSLIE